MPVHRFSSSEADSTDCVTDLAKSERHILAHMFGPSRIDRWASCLEPGTATSTVFAQRPVMAFLLLPLKAIMIF